MEMKYRKDGRKLVQHGSYEDYYSEWGELYTHGMSMTSIAKEYDASGNAVRYGLVCNGIAIREYIKYTSLYTEWKCKYESGTTLSEIAEEYGVDHRIVYYAMKKLGTSMRPAHVRNNHITYDYFSTIDTEVKAYYLGLLYADGSITGGENPRLELELSYPDEYIVEHLAGILNTNTYRRNHKRSNRLPSVRLSVASKLMAEDLANYCIVPNKTYVGTFNLTTVLPSNYVRHTVRGLIDGDGGVRYNMRGNTCKKSLYYCGCLKAVEGVRDIIGCLTGNYSAITADENIYKTGWSAYSDISVIYDYLYKGATIWMKRKRDTMEEILHIGRERGYIN